MSKLQALSPPDQLFLLGESRQQPMHVGCLLFYKVPEGQNSDEVASQRVRDMLSHTTAVKPFNYRLTRKMGLPYWQEDPEFDITNHLNHARLPYPGNIKELLTLVGVAHGATMDRSLPLWQAFVISGLPDNRFAMYVKIHHALADGVSGIRTIVEAHSLDPSETGVPPFWAPKKEDPWGEKPKPPQMRDNKEAGILEANLFSMGADLVKGSFNVMGGLWESWKNDRISLLESDMFHAPDTIFNQRITGARRFVADSFSLSRIKGAGKGLGVKVNDVLLMMTGRALQLYLEEQGELPDDPMRALIPVSLRDENSAGGNEIAMIRASLGTDESSIESLVEAVKTSVNQQKDSLNKLSKNEKQLFTALTLAPFGLHLSTGKLERFRTANIVLSNVPGTRETIYWDGLEVDAMYPVSIPTHEAAVNFTVFSYRDNIEYGITGCRNRVPHLQRILEHMHTALDEIEAVSKSREKKK